MKSFEAAFIAGASFGVAGNEESVRVMPARSLGSTAGARGSGRFAGDFELPDDLLDNVKPFL